MKLLVIADEQHLVEMLRAWLKTRGDEVLTASTTAQARQMWEEDHPDLVLLESGLPSVDALALCRQMRARQDVLVVVLAEGNDVRDEVQWLDAGADDYLRKPFFRTQLLARIHAVSRRVRSTPQQPSSTLITVGPLCVDTLHKEATLLGRSIHLTPIESKLLLLVDEDTHPGSGSR